MVKKSFFLSILILLTFNFNVFAQNKTKINNKTVQTNKLIKNKQKVNDQQKQLESQSQTQVATKNGTLSVACFPDSMVYINGKRLQITPIIRYPLSEGEYKLTILNIGTKQKMQADFRLFILENQETSTSINLGMFANLPPDTPTPYIAPPGYIPPDLNPINKQLAEKQQQQQEELIKQQQIKQQQEIENNSKGLTRNQVQQLMESQRPIIDRCAGNAEGLLVVNVTIVPDGSFQNISISGAFNNTEIGHCVTEQLSQVIFDEFQGDPFTVAFPFRLNR